MRFAFTDDQLAFRHAVRDLLVAGCRPADVRTAWGPGDGVDPKLWTALADMGVLGMLAPLETGGLGLSEVDLVLILEETGRAAMPGPIVEHAAVGVPALVAGGRHDLVVSAASGRATVTVAERADRVGWGASADVVLIAGPDLRLVGGVAATPLDCVDRSRRDAAVTWSTEEVLDGADVGLALDRGALGAAAQLCGLAAQLIDVTAAYVKERRQFGVPVGSYQAVKHHLANALLALSHARPPVYRAAYSIATGAPSAARDVSMAKAMANQAAAGAGRAALQCHGAIGYTWESDLHLWMKRVWVLERAWGDTATHRSRVADALLGSP